jgi:hypothetical protein
VPRSFYALPGNPIPTPSTTLLAQTTNPMSNVVPGVRAEAPTTVDFSLFKTFQSHERARLQLRANAYNPTNTPIFGAPSSTSGVMGIGQVNDPRIVEVAARFMF